MQARSRERLRLVLDAAVEADEAQPLDDPVGEVLDVLVAGFRASPGFLGLWFGGLRTERVRDATRPTRMAIARSIERILARHWPDGGTVSRESGCIRACEASPGYRFQGSASNQPTAGRGYKQ